MMRRPVQHVLLGYNGTAWSHAHYVHVAYVSTLRLTKITIIGQHKQNWLAATTAL